MLHSEENLASLRGNSVNIILGSVFTQVGGIFLVRYAHNGCRNNVGNLSRVTLCLVQQWTTGIDKGRFLRRVNFFHLFELRNMHSLYLPSVNIRPIFEGKLQKAEVVFTFVLIMKICICTYLSKPHIR